LRSRAHHRRPADVDLLDHVVEGRATSDRFPERIEVHDDEVERLDLVGSELVYVVLLPAVREDAGMDPRVQRLHTTLEHLGRAGYLLDRGDVDAGIADRLRRAAARYEFDAEL